MRKFSDVSEFINDLGKAQVLRVQVGDGFGLSGGGIGAIPKSGGGVPLNGHRNSNAAHDRQESNGKEEFLHDSSNQGLVAGAIMCAFSKAVKSFSGSDWTMTWPSTKP